MGIPFKAQMAGLIFPLMRASEISLGMRVSPPFLALCKGGGWENSAREGGGAKLEEKYNKRKERLRGAEGTGVRMSAGN